jgi:hypothetical protein
LRAGTTLARRARHHNGGTDDNDDHASLRFVLPCATLFLLLARPAEASTNCGAPGPNQAIVWQGINFTGNCDVLEIRSYSTADINALSVGNETITAVSVGINIKVTLYENDLPGAGPVGDWLPLVNSRGWLDTFNDKTSAIRVESKAGCAAPGPYQVVVWWNWVSTGGATSLISATR